jgi:hypothetical protein
MFWGYLLGSSMSHQQAPVAAAPTVVVVPGQGVPTSTSQVSPDASTVGTVPPAPAPVVQQPPEDDGIGALGWTLILLTSIGGIFFIVRKANA